jgi:hypothetical protein
MARRPPPYRRLPGRARRFGGFTTLWLGEDHLLLLDSSGYSESYRRLFLKDIQAIVLRRNDRWIGAMAILGLLVVLPGVATAATDEPVRWFWAFPLAAFILAFLVNLLRGPTCACHVMTPLGPTEIKTIRRFRQARRMLRVVRPRIEALQGAMPAEEIAARLAALPAPAPAAERAAAGATGPRPAPPPRPARVLPHALLVTLLVLDAVVAAFQISSPVPALATGGLVLLLAQIACALTAVVRQSGSDLARPVRRFAWISLGFFGGVMVSLVLLTFVEIFSAAVAGQPPPPLPGLQAAGWMALPRLAAALLLSIWGFVVLAGRRRDKEGAWLTLST